VTSDVLTAVDQKVGRIRLDRPKAIHALTRDMCSAMIVALLKWRERREVEAVLLDHAEGRGFCAGGDVVMLARSGAGDGAAARAFFHEEYRLNHLLFTYAMPTVAFMDGIVMGGGVGISQPCKYRVATENTRFAMPETAIGLFPRLDGAECLALGLATHYVPALALDDLKARIAAEPQRLAELLDEASAPAPAATIAPFKQEIDRLFAADDFEAVLAALRDDGSHWARAQLDTLTGKSPQACKVSLRLLYDGGLMQGFADEMRQEYAVASRVVQRHDFVEGVRALLVDKDNCPVWDPPTPQGVTQHVIDQIFAPMPEGEEWTPL
jgi:enoyl-CoA hydratase